MQRYVFSEETRVMKIERPMAVQIVQAQNVGVAKKGSAEGEEQEEDTG